MGAPSLLTHLQHRHWLALAGRLGAHFRGKNLVFPSVTQFTANMLREDSAAVRASFLHSHPKESESDFLTETNAAGKRYDLHALRRARGAWLAMAEVHPKAIQSILWHALITLTMDISGYLFPAMEGDANRKLGELLERQ